MLEASKKLKKHYSEYGNITTKKQGMTEFKLKKMPSRTTKNCFSISNKNTKKTLKIHKK
jgi:hypothetical protein